MKTNLRKVLCAVCIGIVTLLAVFAVRPLFTIDDYRYVNWKLSKDGKTLTDGEAKYTRYDDLPNDIFEDPTLTYSYKNPVLGDMELSAVKKGGDVLWGYHDYTLCVFVNETSKKTLDDFVSGKSVGAYRLINTYGDCGTLDADTLQKLQDMNGSITMESVHLEYALRYYLFVYDQSDVFGKEIGAIYKLNGKLYYLNFQDLPAEYFDSYGDFSYNGNSVTLYELNSQACTAVNEIDFSFRYCEYTWEDGRSFEDSEDVLSEAFFRSYAVWGFLAPVVFFDLGIALPTFFPKRRTKYWYMLMPIAGLWMILALVLLLLII